MKLKRYSSGIAKTHQDQSDTSTDNRPDIKSEHNLILFHELDTYLVELEMQNEILRTTQEELTDALTRYSDLYDFSPIGYLTLSDKSKILEANLTISEMLATDPQAIIDKQFTSYIAAEDQDIYYFTQQKLRKTGSRQTSELRLKTAQGDLLNVRLDCVPRDSSTGILTFRIAVSNIGDLKEMENQLIQLKDRYWAIVMDQNDLICRFTPDGKLTFVNDAYCKCFGVSFQQVLGTNFLPNIYYDDLPLVQNHFSDLTLLKPANTIEHRVILPGGDIRWQQWCGRTFFDQDGKAIECQAVGRDITQQKAAEKRLQEEVRLRQHFMDALPCIALLLKYETREIVASNKAAVAAGAVAGKQCYRTWVQRDTPCPWCLASKLWAEGKAQHNQFWRKGVFWDTYWIPVGDNLFLHYAFDTTKQENNKVALQLAHDQLEQRVAERTKELEKTHQQLLHSEKLSAIGRLSASIAHEFNNPLQAITNVLGGVRRRASLDAEDVQLVDLAQKECVRLKELVRNLQDFYRPTSGRSAQLSVHAILDDLITLSKKELKTKGIQVKKHYAEQLPLLHAVIDQIKQVFLNLLTNAVDACQQGDTITVKTFSEANTIVVQIQDTGAGIEPGMLPHLFEPFFTTKTEMTGTGLGLAVSYGIVAKHGGAISVDSTPGEGSIFTITLPVDTTGRTTGN